MASESSRAPSGGTIKSRTNRARKELADAAESIWSNLRTYVLADVQSDDSVLVARMTDLFVDIGTKLETETDLRRDINEGMVTVLSNLVENEIIVGAVGKDDLDRVIVDDPDCRVRGANLKGTDLGCAVFHEAD